MTLNLSSCLTLTNCCKTTGPLHICWYWRVSKYLETKPQQFITQYLRVDEDQDYGVLQISILVVSRSRKCLRDLMCDKDLSRIYRWKKVSTNYRSALWKIFLFVQRLFNIVEEWRRNYHCKCLNCQW
jgi:hypothetical protein